MSSTSTYLASDLPPLQSIKPRRKEQLVSEDQRRPYEGVFSAAGSLPSNASEANAVAVVEPLPGVIYLDNLMTTQECAMLCEKIDASPSSVLSFWSGTGREDEEARRFRDADTIEIQSPFIAEVLWERVKLVLPGAYFQLSISAGDIERSDNFEKDLLGDWRAEGLNEDLLFARYPPLGAFAPHTDGRSIKDFNTRSFYSVIVFLNNIPLEYGGSTKFYSSEATKSLVKTAIVDKNEMTSSPLDATSSTIEQSGSGSYRWSSPDQYLLSEVEAKAGRMLIFEQRYVHEGSLVVPPNCKYIIRSDVMFRRADALFDSEADRAAYALYRQGEELSESGHVDEAIKLFKKAFRMSPALEAIYG
jgi:hypothetical protein